MTLSLERFRSQRALHTQTAAKSVKPIARTDCTKQVATEKAEFSTLEEAFVELETANLSLYGVDTFIARHSVP